MVVVVVVEEAIHRPNQLIPPKVIRHLNKGTHRKGTRRKGILPLNHIRETSSHLSPAYCDCSFEADAKFRPQGYSGYPPPQAPPSPQPGYGYGRPPPSPQPYGGGYQQVSGILSSNRSVKTDPYI